MGGERAERLKGAWANRSLENHLSVLGFRSEEIGEYEKAAYYYLEDALRLEKSCERALAAVSYAAAARCFELTGNMDSAAHYYLRAAEMFENAASGKGERADALRDRAAGYRELAEKLAVSGLREKRTP